MLLEGISVSYSSSSRWDVLACVDVQGDVCCCNSLRIIDLGAISRHIACVLLGGRRKNIAFTWIRSVF